MSLIYPYGFNKYQKVKNRRINTIVKKMRELENFLYKYGTLPSMPPTENFYQYAEKEVYYENL